MDENKEHKNDQTCKETETSFHDSAQNYRNIIDNAAIGIATVALNGQFMQVNQAFCNITGYEKEELKKINYKKLTYTEDLAADIDKVDRLLSGKIKSYQLEKRYVRKDNKIIWVQVTRSLMRDTINDMPLYFIAQAEDITERKSASEELRKTSNELADLYEHAPCGYHSLDENDVFIRMNATEL